MRPRTRAAFALLGAAIIAAATFAAAAPAQADFHGTYLQNVRSRKCATAITGSTAILEEPCTDAPGQAWFFGPGLTTNQPFQISLYNTNTCIDMPNFADGTPVAQTDCNLQQIGSYWFRQSAGTTTIGFSQVPAFRYKAAYANVCLDLRGGWPDDGTPIQTYTCNNNTDNMRWYHIGPV
jgi:hypothetical protein